MSSREGRLFVGDVGQIHVGSWLTHRLELGIEFENYWLSPAAMERQVIQAGFEVVLWVGRPADPDEAQAQGYLIARRR